MTGCDTGSILKKQSTVGLNSEFSELLFLRIAGGGENWWIHAFPNSISVKGKSNSLVQDLNSGHQIQRRQLLRNVAFYFIFADAHMYIPVYQSNFENLSFRKN